MRSVLLACVFCSALSANAAYRCEGPGGISIQDSPCRKGDAARSVDLSARYTAPPPAAALPAKISSEPAMAKPTKLPVLPPFVKNPNSPNIRMAYNSAYSPFDDATMGRLIQQAMSRWNEHCNVNLIFEGFTNADPPKRQSQQSGLFIRWNDPKNPAHMAEGSPTHGVVLSPSFLGQKSTAYVLHVLAHEIGHVLGIGHIHEDPDSVMSYNRKAPAEGSDGTAGYLSPSDTASCNLAMQMRHGVAILTPYL